MNNTHVGWRKVLVGALSGLIGYGATWFAAPMLLDALPASPVWVRPVVVIGVIAAIVLLALTVLPAVVREGRKRE